MITDIENSSYFKKMLAEHFLREEEKRLMFSPDCAECLQVEAGDIISYPGIPCHTCGVIIDHWQ